MLAHMARRWSVVSAVVASLALFALFRHALHESMEHGDEHGAHCAVVVCLVIATLPFPVGPLAQPRLPRRESADRLQPQRVPAPADSPPQARASPGWLQRFLN